MILVYDEFVDFIAAGPSSEAVIQFQPSADTKQRVVDLIHRQKTDVLTADGTSELNYVLQIEHLMRLAKTRARLARY